jgi:predicted TIM-barrel fold metal-dependent hydrolase
MRVLDPCLAVSASQRHSSAEAYRKVGTSRLLSADSHVIEPPNLFHDHIDAGFRDLAPRVERADDGTIMYVVGDGIPPWIPGVGASAGRIGKSMEDARRMGYDALDPAGWDPDARIRAQDEDGVVAEVIYPTLGRALFDIDNDELRRACLRAYTDWLAKEFCHAHPDRLIGVALIDLTDVRLAIAELERARTLGYRAVGIWDSPPEERPYSFAVYAPFWEAAIASEMTVSLHVGSSGNRAARERNRAARAAVTAGAMVKTGAPDVIQSTIQDMVVGGVLERHPGLRVVSVENNIGWVPYFLQSLDKAYERWSRRSESGLTLKPSDYVHRQIFFTFETDPVGAKTWQLFGKDNYLWASDFPHPASTWPHSTKEVERDFEGQPEHVVRKITHDNAAQLYRVSTLTKRG